MNHRRASPLLCTSCYLPRSRVLVRQGSFWLAAIGEIHEYCIRFPIHFLKWFAYPLQDILAFEVVAGLCVTYLGIAGLVIYFSLFGVDEYDKLSANKFDARSEFMENHMIYPMISYQGAMREVT